METDQERRCHRESPIPTLPLAQLYVSPGSLRVSHHPPLGSPHSPFSVSFGQNLFLFLSNPLIMQSKGDTLGQRQQGANASMCSPLRGHFLRSFFLCVCNWQEAQFSREEKSPVLERWNEFRFLSVHQNLIAFLNAFKLYPSQVPKYICIHTHICLYYIYMYTHVGFLALLLLFSWGKYFRWLILFDRKQY